MITKMAADISSTAELHSFMISFDNIVNRKLIYDLRKTIKGVQVKINNSAAATATAAIAGAAVAVAPGAEFNSLKLHLNRKLEKLGKDLSYIHESFTHLRKFEEHVVTPFEIVSNRVENLVAQIRNDDIDNIVKDETFNQKFVELDKMLTNMKIHIPSSHKMYTSSSATNAQTQQRLHSSDTMKLVHGDPQLPILQTRDSFSRSPAFLDIKEVYDSLGDRSKLCLLCFSIFPENVIVKRRILLYWWIGERLILLNENKAAGAADDTGAAADKILKELVKKGFIEPVDQKYGPVAKSFRMHPFIRSAVIVLSKQARFFDFDNEGKPTINFESSRRACLVGVGSSSRLTKRIGNNVHQLNQQKLNTLYNVNEQYLRLSPEWFLKLKNLRVLQLGRWLNSAPNRIQVEHVEFLKMLTNMKHLMYFSLQGISGISELPDTIGELTNLRILDLRACLHLEKLPSNICLLLYLTHLDMSECYLLGSVPKEIALLSRLEVLKGFVIGDPHGGGDSGSKDCTLDDLKALVSLRKLSISTGSKDFPSDVEVRSINQFKALLNLKIVWGGNSLEKAIEAESNSHWDSKKDGRGAALSNKKFQRSKTVLERSKTIFRDRKKNNNLRRVNKFLKAFAIQTSSEEIETALPAQLKKLEKLDLQCFPHTKRPSWLHPRRLEGVKKLYIRGGRLSNLCDEYGNEPWNVEVLYLKHLSELSMDWTERQKSFPKLKYLELFNCRNLEFFPCDDQGVWTPSDL